MRRALAIAIDAYEDEISRQLGVREGYVVMLGITPMLVLPTRHIARQQLKLMKRMDAHGEGVWRIARTQVAAGGLFL